MKNECYVVRDLLPLYLDDLVSDETRAFVDAHLAGCDECRALVEKEKVRSKALGEVETVPLRRINKLVNRQKVRSILLAVVLVLALLLTGFAYMTTPTYFPYSKDLLTVTDSDGLILITFNDSVTGFDFNTSEMTEGNQDTQVTYLSAWTTLWDQKFLKRGMQTVTLNPGPESDQAQVVFYSSNNGDEATQIYGSPVGYHTMELPRLVLSLYLWVAILAGVVCGGLLVAFRKNEKLRYWLERITLFSPAYVISHLLVMGLKTSTYSSGRDFSFILFFSILIFVAGLLGLNWVQHSRQMKTL